MKAQRGNARRRALLALVRERTVVTYPAMEFACAGCGDWAAAAWGEPWECSNCEYGGDGVRW